MNRLQATDARRILCGPLRTRITLLKRRGKLRVLRHTIEINAVNNSIGQVDADIHRSLREQQMLHDAVDRNGVPEVSLVAQHSCSTSSRRTFTSRTLRHQISFLSTCHVMLERVQTNRDTLSTRRKLLGAELEVTAQTRSIARRDVERLQERLKWLTRLQRHVTEALEYEDLEDQCHNRHQRG